MLKTTKNYLSKSDWRVKENSTIDYGIGGLILNQSERATAEYWREEIYDLDIKDAHDNTYIHIHDLGFLGAYCAGWSIKDLLLKGLSGVEGKTSSAPAKHLMPLINQMVNFIGIGAQEWAGAQAYSSVDTYLAPFIREDNMTYKEVKQCMQSFIFGLNFPNRWGSQSPFSNITLDWTIPNDLKNEPCIVGGELLDYNYGELQDEVDMINKAFLEIMIGGDANGRGFQYPIPTYSITKEFDFTSENAKLLFEMTSKYGTPYFSNYVNSDMNPEDVRSMAILGSQEVIYKNQNGDVAKNEIRHLVSNWIKSPQDKKPKYEMLMNGSFVNVIDMFEVNYEEYSTYVNIELEDGYNQNFSHAHKCAVVRDGKFKEIESQDLLVGDKFILSKKGYDESTIGDYKSGKMLGYYLGDGWINTHSKGEICLSINIKREDIITELKEYFNKMACKVKINKIEEDNIYKINIYGKQAVGFVKNYIIGKSATSKRLNNTVWNTSIEFRKGIVDGLYETDGHKERKILFHTTNKSLAEDLIILVNSIGKTLKYRENNKNTRYFKKDKSDKETFTSYELKFKDNYSKFELDGSNYDLVEIKNVRQVAANTDKVYNFTVDTKRHLYELPNGIITHQCCRLQLDLRELRKKNGGYFGSGENTGSIGVVTINLPKLAYESTSEEDFYRKLIKYLNISKRSLELKRETITEFMKRGLYKYSKEYLGDYSNHFSTIGIIGGAEAIRNADWLETDNFDNGGKDFLLDIMTRIKERLKEYQEETGHLYNLESTPAESTTYRFASHDKEQYPDIKTAGEEGETPYYTNSTHLPVDTTRDVFDALDVQDDLQVEYTSGTVFHAFLGQKLSDWETTANLVSKIANNYRLPYFTISPTYSICTTHGYITGEYYKCPNCGNNTEVYSRITGYYRPINNWNDGKLQEFEDRTEYNES